MQTAHTKKVNGNRVELEAVPEQESQRGTKRRGTDLQDLYRSEVPEQGSTDEPVVVFQQGGSSGSGIANPAPEPMQEEAELNIGFIEKVFHNQGVKCSRTEAECLSNLVASLGVGHEANSVLNEGLWLNLEGGKWKLLTDKEFESMFKTLERTKPLLLTGLPSSGAFVELQRQQNDLQKVSRDEARKQITDKRKSMRAYVDAYRQQVHEGRYFLQECPKGTKDFGTSQYLSLHEDAVVVEGPMCTWTVDETGGRLAGSKIRKRTRWITNSIPVAKALKVICKSSDTKAWKRTLTFEEGRVRIATNYPPKLLEAIARGVKAQLVLDGQTKEIGHVGGPDPHEEANYEDYQHDMLPDATELYVKEPVIDANSGVELEPKKVAVARATELEWIKKQNVYSKVPTEMCYQETSRPPITLKWVDRNKGDATKENYRSRLVVREIKSQGQAALIPEHALFSSMPPLEALKLLCSLMVTLRVSRGGGKLSLKLTDISRAHFYGRAVRRIFVTLPEGDESPGFCGLLNRTMYGTRDASATWQKDYTELLNSRGFTVGQAWPCIFVHKERDIRLLVHGDDFLVLADEQGHAFVDQVLKERYEFKCDGHIGPGQERQTMSVLNRLITYHANSGLVTYEADPRHSEALIRELHLENAKPAKTPGEKKKHSEVMKTLELPPLDEGMQKQYRSLTMRAAFLAQDRPDIAEATKCLARHMKTPNEAAFNDLKRLVRYLRGRPRLVYEYWPQRYQRDLTTFCDSDHAGCLITRRSTTGLITMWGSHNIKHSSNIQSTISLSSGESEFYPIVKAAAVSLSIQALMADWGLEVSVKIKSDSSAARGTSQRQGLGSTRHIETRFLWVQEKIQRKAFTLEKVSTNSNYSDICTKPLPEAALDKHLRSMNLKFTTEKASGAKQLV